MVGPIDPQFLSLGAKMSNVLHSSKWSTGITLTFSKTVNPSEIDWTVIEKSWPEHDWPQTEHVYAICCWLEVADDVTSIEDVDTFVCYVRAMLEELD